MGPLHRLKLQLTLPGPQLTCALGKKEEELMRNPVGSSRVLSVKCQRNVKCLSKTASGFCGLAGGLAASHVSWITGNWRMDPSTYRLPSSFLSGSQQAFTHIHTLLQGREAHKVLYSSSHSHTHTDTNVHTKHTNTHTHTSLSDEVEKRSIFV